MNFQWLEFTQNSIEFSYKITGTSLLLKGAFVAQRNTYNLFKIVTSVTYMDGVKEKIYSFDHLITVPGIYPANIILLQKNSFIWVASIIFAAGVFLTKKMCGSVAKKRQQ